MSDKNDEQDLEPIEAEQESVDEAVDDIASDVSPPAEGAPAEEAPAEQKPAKRRGNGVAWLALLLSLVALAAVGYTISQDWLAASDTAADDAIGRLDNRVAAARQGLSELDARISELDSRDSSDQAEIDALRQELDERVRLLSSLPARMTTLESSVSSLAGISDGARDAWLIAEAEYYMQIANAQLQLANNPQLAALALGMADERVVQMSNPALIDVRRAIF